MSDYTSLVRSLREAVDMKDIDSIMDHFHPEMVYISSFDVKKNREELREEYLLAFDRHPDVGYDIRRIITSGDTVVVELNYHFTHTVDYEDVKATNKYIEFPVVFVYDMKDSKIRRFQIYYNIKLMEQLMRSP